MSSINGAYQKPTTRATSRLAQTLPQSGSESEEGDEGDGGDDDAEGDADYLGEEEGGSEDEDMSDDALPKLQSSTRDAYIHESSRAKQSLRSFPAPEKSIEDAPPNENLISLIREQPLKRRSLMASTGPKRERRGYLKPQMRGDAGFSKIVKDLAKQLGPARLAEPDHIVVETEDLVAKFHYGRDDSQNRATETQDEQLSESVRTTVPQALSRLWQSCCNPDRRTKSEATIGPHPRESNFAKATYLSNLLLKLHYPPARTGGQGLVISRNPKSSLFSKSLSITGPPRSQPFPEVLVSWLFEEHEIDGYTIQRIFSESTKSVDFWYVLQKFVLRGQLKQALRLLLGADFSKAETARGDGGSSMEGYSQSQLSHIKIAAKSMVQVMQSCPAIVDGDWEVVGNDWKLFRNRAEQALLDLIRLAEGDDGDQDEGPAYVEAPNFGMSGPSNSMRQSFRRAESRVPWTIYQHLKTIYEIILGGVSEIMSCSDDWLEATMSLTIWWDGTDDEVDEVPMGSLRDTRRSLNQSAMRSQRKGPRGVDLNATAAYLERLMLAFQHSTESMHQVNAMNIVEVGLASIFENDIAGVLDLLHSLSMPIATATIEIATDDGWYKPDANGRAQMNGFDKSDLMVLSYGGPQLEHPAITKDAFLEEYASVLFEKESIKSDGMELEGWELAVEVLMRLSNPDAAHTAVKDMLGKLRVENDERVSKIVSFCRNAGLEEEAAKCSEVSTTLQPPNIHAFPRPP